MGCKMQKDPKVWVRYVGAKEAKREDKEEKGVMEARESG